eukprot:m.368313 g.368313  ORF g.368313 m.368313 type:complete len:283 (+) comp20842_c1_seq28:661-1509(+)
MAERQSTVVSHILTMTYAASLQSATGVYGAASLLPGVVGAGALWKMRFSRVLRRSHCLALNDLDTGSTVCGRKGFRPRVVSTCAAAACPNMAGCVPSTGTTRIRMLGLRCSTVGRVTGRGLECDRWHCGIDAHVGYNVCTRIPQRNCAPTISAKYRSPVAVGSCHGSKNTSHKLTLPHKNPPLAIHRTHDTRHCTWRRSRLGSESGRLQAQPACTSVSHTNTPRGRRSGLQQCLFASMLGPGVVVALLRLACRPRACWPSACVARSAVPVQEGRGRCLLATR